MRNCPTCGRTWRRLIWEWARRATPRTRCGIFPRRRQTRPAPVRSRVRRRPGETEWRRGYKGLGAMGRISPINLISPIGPLGPIGPIEMRELKLENSLVDNRFEVVERLNRGSFAEIFVARDREAGGMEVVIKALNTSLQGTPDADLERTLIENFQNEAVALDAVRHPHVILRWGHGTASDLRETPFHYLVIEYMPGGDLLKLCRARPDNALPLDEALLYFKQVCEALAYAHDKGIIHRDLKPNNFLLSADHRTLKIADFGVAKIATGEDNELT